MESETGIWQDWRSRLLGSHAALLRPGAARRIIEEFEKANPRLTRPAGMDTPVPELPERY